MRIQVAQLRGSCVVAFDILRSYHYILLVVDSCDFGVVATKFAFQHFRQMFVHIINLVQN